MVLRNLECVKKTAPLQLFRIQEVVIARRLRRGNFVSVGKFFLAYVAATASRLPRCACNDTFPAILNGYAPLGAAVRSEPGAGYGDAMVSRIPASSRGVVTMGS